LKKEDTLTLQQLFYAMLLPSGNDAALVLADYFGEVIA
jgi:D-alanyl-D-alanine carboxypeptidase